MAIYMYLGPFSSRVTAEIEQRIAASYQAQPATGAIGLAGPSRDGLGTKVRIKAKLT